MILLCNGKIAQKGQFSSWINVDIIGKSTHLDGGQLMIFETERLRIRKAVVEDADFYVRLWSDPRVMVHVGFPNGLPATKERTSAQLGEQGETEFDRLLVIELRETGQVIGEAKMHSPDKEGVSGPDVKLLPEFWGHKYGAEGWQGLVDYLFTHTDCTAVDGWPNVNNIASIKMQSAAGAVRIGEETYEFPEAMRDFTAPVHCYQYQLLRADWQNKKKG